MADESLIQLVGLWLTVSLDCIFVCVVAWLLARTLARYRPAWQSFVWMAALASFPCLLLLEWTGSGPSRPAVALLEHVPASRLHTLVQVYIGISAVLLGLVVHSCVRLHLLCNYSTPLDISFESDDALADASCRPITEQRGLVLQGAGLYVSGQISAPTSFGILRPLVLLPEPPTGTVYRRFVRAAVVHELIKVLRFDALWTLLARLTQCLFFAHPLVWWMFRRYCLAREQVCDRWTVRATGDVSEYETHLLAVANTRRRTSLMSIDTPMDFTGPSGLRKRILDLQNYERPESLRPWPTIAAAVVWMLLLAVVAAVRIELHGTRYGLAVDVWPMLMGAVGAFTAGAALTVILAIGRARRVRLAPPVDGLAGCSRQTVAECVDRLNREWQDLQTALSLTARRLEPVFLMLVVVAATVSFWWVAGPMAGESQGPAEAQVHDFYWPR